MTILITLIIGLVAGALAKLIMPGPDRGGIILTMALGVIGALLGTYLGRAFGWYAPDESAGLFGAIVGSVIVLAIYRLIRGTPSERV
jgi:uncharacterized membrane protein YeaQ/YmgE (transglycosylase-associated protein family)